MRGTPMRSGTGAASAARAAGCIPQLPLEALAAAALGLQMEGPCKLDRTRQDLM